MAQSFFWCILPFKICLTMKLISEEENSMIQLLGFFRDEAFIDYVFRFFETTLKNENWSNISKWKIYFISCNIRANTENLVRFYSNSIRVPSYYIKDYRKSRGGRNRVDIVNIENFVHVHVHQFNLKCLFIEGKQN